MSARFNSLLCLLAALTGCGADNSSADSRRQHANPGTGAIDPAGTQKLMALRLPDLAGAEQALAQWKGRILVVNYWATWCAPCKEEMPAFSRLYKQYARNGVQFVGISIDAADKVRRFQQETPVEYPLLLGSMETMQTSVALGNAIQGLPFTVILDRRGEVYSTKLGRFPEEVLEQRLQALLRD